MTTTPPEHPDEGSGTSGYGAPPPPSGYGAPGYPAPGPQPVVGGTYAAWPIRVLSAMIDWFGPAVVAGLVFQANRPLGTLLQLAALGWTLYNAYLGGQTGQSYGKKMAGTRLVSETTGQTIGGGMGIARAFVHILDALPCYLGFLWPIWDPKRQTFADKLIKTIVVMA